MGYRTWLFGIDLGTYAFVCITGLTLLLGSFYDMFFIKKSWVRVIILFTAAGCAALAGVHRETHIRQVDAVVQMVEARSIKVVDYDYLTDRVTVEYDACVVSYKFNTNQVTDGHKWPLVPGTAENRGNHPHCQPERFMPPSGWRQSMDNSFIYSPLIP